ncbi:MAG: hypothetical protein M3439_07325, partial [Chloroflexota bacterium]|nr:hypothetical protein [Chloroflexota bacterium]
YHSCGLIADVIVCWGDNTFGQTDVPDSDVPASDNTVPTITPSVVGDAGANSWYTSDVTVTWTVTDDESAISSSTGCETTSISTDTSGTTLTCSATSAGGPSTQSVTIKRDATAPVVTFTGNQGTYGLLDTVTIDCAATDATSGIASDTCQNVSAPAYTFGPGEHVISASATDMAGNTGSAETRFVVTASHDGLCTLTKELVSNRGTERAACALLTAAERAEQRGQARLAQGPLIAYRVMIGSAIRVGHISAEDGATLIAFSRTL